MPGPDEQPVPASSENGSGSGTAEVSGLGFRLKLTGRLARQAMMVVGFAGGLATVLWYAAFSKPQLILQELKGLRTDVIKTQVMAGAIVDTLPAVQKVMAQKVIGERLAVLELAQAQK
jgi:hypothetical protein